MFLQSYVHAGCGDTELLEPAVVAAMTPLWVGRTPSEELVGIGTTGTATGAIITWPLADLRDDAAADRFFHTFTQTQCRSVWLMAFTQNPVSLAGPLAHLATAADHAWYSYGSPTVAVTDYGRRWAAIDRNQAPALTELDFQPVPELDPVAARMWLLACRAGREQSRTLQTLRRQRDPETFAAAERARDSIQQTRNGIDAAVQAADNAAALQRALAEPELPDLRHTVALGMALEEDSALLAAAIDAIWTADTTTAARADLWQHLAAAATGDAYGTTTALVALAAWRTGDLAYATAVLEHAVDIGGSPLIGWLCDLLAHGVPAADLHAGAPLIPAHLPGAMAGRAEQEERA